MVFGFFEGSIELQLDKTNLAFGETLHGKLNLKLKKEKKARQLRVTIKAVKAVTQYGKRSGVRVMGQPVGSNSNQGEVVFSTDAILDGEKTYLPPGGEYEFRIQVPQKSVMPQSGLPELAGNLGKAVQVAQMLSGFGMSAQIKWFVEGVLDIPGGVDISKRLQVSVQ